MRVVFTSELFGGPKNRGLVGCKNAKKSSVLGNCLVVYFGVTDGGLGNPIACFAVGTESINSHGRLGEKFRDKLRERTRTRGDLLLRQQAGREGSDVENGLLFLA